MSNDHRYIPVTNGFTRHITPIFEPIAVLPLLAICRILRVGALRHEREFMRHLPGIANLDGYSENKTRERGRDQHRLDCSDDGFPFVQISRLGRSTRRGTPTGVPIDFMEVIPQLHTGRQSRPVKSGPVMRVMAECKDGDPPPGLQGSLPSPQPSADYIRRRSGINGFLPFVLAA